MYRDVVIAIAFTFKESSAVGGGHIVCGHGVGYAGKPICVEVGGWDVLGSDEG
jgi:hypothetical protein